LSQSAYITFVDGSLVDRLELEDVKAHLNRYCEQLAQTGKQLNWHYNEVAFPYTMETRAGEEDLWFYLKGTEQRYKHILFGVGTSTEGETTRAYVQIVLPDTATHGDKSKGIELANYMAKRLQARLTLFNGRIIYYNPRK